MRDERKKDLCQYRMGNSADSLQVAQDCFLKEYYKDAIAYFNQTYVASGLIPKEIGKKTGRLQQKREKSDYDDFYLSSKEETAEQIENAKEIIAVIQKYLKEKRSIDIH